MRVSEKGVLAILALILLAFSTIAQTKILERGAASSTTLSWQGEVGFYLPFVLFALVSTYHFLEWARKHKRQAIVMMLLIVGVTSLIGTATANVPKPVAIASTSQEISLTQPQSSSGSVIQVPQQPASLQESIINLRDALNSTPYFSIGFNALTLLASAVAVALVLLKMGRERSTPEPRPSIKPALIDVQATAPRDIIIQSYLLACASMQVSGLQMPDSDTPSDVFARVKQLKPNIADTLWRLTLLFEEAKFSLHSISEAQADEAAGCFRSIRQDAVGTIQR
jgi:hypothetical protein